MSSDATEAEALRVELASLRVAGRVLQRQLDEARRQSATADALEREEGDVAMRMARLEPVLDLAAVTAHVRRALDAGVADASRTALAVEQLLPAEVCRAAVEAMPWRAGEDRPGDPNEASVPAKAAPTYAIATWMFLNDVAKDLLAPELLARLTGAPVAVELRLARSHVARRAAPAAPAPRSPEALLLVVALDGEAAGRARAVSGSVAALDLQAGSDEHALEWRVAFTAGNRPRAASRRRHGDIRSWTHDGRGA